MLVARVAKETTDIRRVILDWTKWLDPGETIEETVGPTIITAWPNPAPYDPTPLVVANFSVTDSSTRMVFLFASGNPRFVYKATTVGKGTSGRSQTVEIMIVVRDAPGPVSGSSGGGSSGGGGDTGGGTGGSATFTLDRSLLDGPDLLG